MYRNCNYEIIGQKLVTEKEKSRKVVAAQRLFGFFYKFCLRANPFSLISMAEQGRGYEYKTPVLFTYILSDSRLFRALRKKIDLKGANPSRSI